MVSMHEWRCPKEDHEISHRKLGYSLNGDVEKHHWLISLVILHFFNGRVALESNTNIVRLFFYLKMKAYMSCSMCIYMWQGYAAYFLHSTTHRSTSKVTTCTFDTCAFNIMD